MKTSVHGLTAAAVTLAAALSLSLSGPHRAYGAPQAIQSDSGLAVTVLSPTPRSSFSGVKPVEISAFYQGSNGNQITTIELVVDGVPAASKKLEAPEIRGVISFLIDASALTSGTHRIVVRATGADGEIVSARSSFIYQAPVSNDTPAAPVGDSLGAPPQLSFINPSLNGQVMGTVKLQLNTQDPSGKTPYVSIFVDRELKTIKNYPPYEYEWDTSSYSNGYHTVDAFGYDDEQNVGHAKSLRLYVNNPGGRTERRTDLQDALPAAKHAAKAPARRAKTILPGGALLATRPNRTASELAAPVYMAKRGDLLNGTMSLSMTPELSDPFVPAAAAKPTWKKAIAPVRRAPLKNTGPTAVLSAVKTVAPATMMASIAQSDSNAPAQATQIAKGEDLSAETSRLTLAPGLSNPFIASPEAVPAAPKARPVAPQTLPAALRPSHESAVPGPVEGTLAADMSQSAGQAPVQIAKNDFTPDTSRLEVAPGLSSPFVASENTPAAAPKPQSAPKPVTSDGVLAETAAIPANEAQSPKLLQISDARAPLAALGSPFLIAPTLQRALPQAQKMAYAAVGSSVHQAVTHTVRVHTAGTGSLFRSKGQTSVLFNSKTLRLDRPISSQGHILFSPLRQIFLFQGGTLDWLPRANSVHAVSSTKDILLTMGQKNITVNQTAVLLPSAPYLADGRTMVPFSFFSQAMDMNVQYDEASGHVLITSKK